MTPVRGIRTVLLAEHPNALVPLAAAYQREWPEWYGAHSDALADLRERSRRVGLPKGFVALEDRLPIGAIAIAEKSVSSHAHLSPWIVGFWVEPAHRNRGVGARLLVEACSHAHGQGLHRLYAATAGASRLFMRTGWRAVDTGASGRGGSITVFCKNLLQS